MSKTIAVIGSRGFNDYNCFKERIKFFTQNIENYSFTSGGANGADKFISDYCKEFGYELTEHLPDYNKYSGKVAPIKRNHLIVEDADLLIAFWDGVSRGTAYTLKLADKKGIPIRIVKI